MRVICHLRRIRGDRKMVDLAHQAGIHIGDLSRIERGILLPTDAQLDELERVYGARRQDFYSAGTVAITTDAEAAA